MNLKECPCCGEKTLMERDNYEICKVCGWEDDDIQSADPDYAGGANHISLNEARKAWSEGKDLPQCMTVAFQTTDGASADDYWERVLAKHAPKQPEVFLPVEAWVTQG